jgi:peptidoglycan lytic transglycosylase
VGRSLTISANAAAGERVFALHDRIEVAEQPRRSNDMARQARGLSTRLGMAGFPNATFRAANPQDDQSSGDTHKRETAGVRPIIPGPLPKKEKRMKLRHNSLMALLAVTWSAAALAEIPAPDSPEARREAERLAGLPPIGSVMGRVDPSRRKQQGRASYCGRQFAHRRMADGRPMKPQSNVAASKSLPLGTTAKVTNLRNGRSATVNVQDRGPYARGRVMGCQPVGGRATRPQEAGNRSGGGEADHCPATERRGEAWRRRSRGDTKRNHASSGDDHATYEYRQGEDWRTMMRQPAHLSSRASG